MSGILLYIERRREREKKKRWWSGVGVVNRERGETHNNKYISTMITTK